MSELDNFLRDANCTIARWTVIPLVEHRFSDTFWPGLKALGLVLKAWDMLIISEYNEDPSTIDFPSAKMEYRPILLRRPDIQLFHLLVVKVNCVSSCLRIFYCFHQGLKASLSSIILFM